MLLDAIRDNTPQSKINYLVHRQHERKQRRCKRKTIKGNCAIPIKRYHFEF